MTRRKKCYERAGARFPRVAAAVAVGFWLCASATGARAAEPSRPTEPSRAAEPAPADSFHAASAVPGDSIDAAMSRRVDVHFTPLPDTMLVRMLRQGGLVLAFRHANTDMSQQDSDVWNLANRATQRNLTETGRANATNVGRAIGALGIPIGVVRSSPFWRCRDTATLAFGRCDTTSALYSKGPAFKRARWILLTTAPAPGRNDVLVTHQDALLPLTTLKRDELQESEALIVEPRGPTRGFHVIAHVGPADWLRLARSAGVTVTGLVPVPTPAAADSTSPKR